ncbi:hypothetical protein [Allorhizocola rhizosphaerae]|uniref:hypothetical protein n=1 Tax=Allorhizocola rhizosphaerae TaxID=1872709 RepID=UPI0013C2D033|nr:hypothetical protein [Allorhizocola rhizosphaerae]
MTEIPDADRAEQERPFDPEAEEDVEFPSPPLDAPEADVVEQSIPIPYEDDYR